MAKLNLHRLKEFCFEHNRQKLWEFVRSYIFRDGAALYHISNIQDRLEIAKQPSYIQKIHKVELELQFEVDALILTLNSMFDIVAQIINEAILTPKLPTKEVNLKKVRESESLSNDFQERIDLLRGDKIYNKIREYSNISKHIKVIDGQLTIDFRPDSPQTIYITDEFGSKQLTTLDVKDLEKCREVTKKRIESLIALVDTTLQSIS